MQKKQDREKAQNNAPQAVAPVQVRITVAPEDLEEFAEFLTGRYQVNVSPMIPRPRSRGVAQGYITVHIEGEGT